MLLNNEKPVDRDDEQLFKLYIYFHTMRCFMHELSTSQTGKRLRYGPLSRNLA